MEVGVGGEVCEGWFVVTGPTLAVPGTATYAICMNPALNVSFSP